MGDERGGTAPDQPVRRVRITWTQDLVDCLLGIANGLDPTLKGREREEALEKEWNSLQPTLTSSGVALAAKVRRTLYPKVLPRRPAPPDPVEKMTPADGNQLSTDTPHKVSQNKGNMAINNPTPHSLHSFIQQVVPETFLEELLEKLVAQKPGDWQGRSKTMAKGAKLDTAMAR